MSAREERDSVFAQLLADREGPRVDIRAQYTSLVAGSRRLRAAFHVEDDAYVVIGHVDAEGVVRIVFPSTPDDNGFVKGGRSYQSAEFFGGFTDSYRFRAQTYGRFAAFRPDAYDAQFGYLFIVASWRPMNTQQFATEGRWDSFEVSDRDMYDDPRPAIYELAALMAGENREAYTVKFARYYNTMDLTPGYGGTSAYGLCTSGYNGWRFYGFPSFRPIDLVGRAGYNSVEYYRGRAYVYDSFAGCYTPAPYGGYYPYFQPRIAQTPPLGQPTSGVPTRGRVFAADDSHRQPIEPRPPVSTPRVAPVQARDIGPVDVVNSSPRYRDRGLITEDEGSQPPTRNPRVQVQAENTRPSISKMTERRAREATDESSYRGGNARARMGNDYVPPVVEPPRQRATRENPNGGNEGRTYTPRPENASPPREPIAQPRVAAPAAESRPTAPTPPPATPRTEPPASGAGSSIRPITP